MSDDEVAAIKKLGQDIRYWKKFAFRGFAVGVLNLDDAIESLDGPCPVIYARQDYPARWLVCKAGSQHKAMFHTAVVWAGSSHLDTGNYVPEGQTAPTNMPESRIQRIPSNRCQIDYIVKTLYDKSLFSQQAAFERLVSREKGFNKGGKPRRSWQKGDDGYDSTFTFSAQIFVRPYGYDVAKLKEPSYTLHPWVRDVVQPTSGKQDYFANPHRPEFWDCRSGKMTKMENADPPFPQKGDIMWTTFHTEFIVGSHTWSPQLTPRHFIRVGTVPKILMDSADGMGSLEQEPEYNIEEGAAVVLNVDFPMDDETMNDPDIVAVSRSLGTREKLDGALGDKAHHDAIRVPSGPATESPDTGDAAMNIVNDVEPSHVSDGDKQLHVPNHTDESSGTVAPAPASPGAKTDLTVSTDVDGAIRGVKREGECDDAEIGAPSKKTRQTGTRRARNV